MLQTRYSVRRTKKKAIVEISGWDEAISDAKKRIKNLLSAIEVFQQNKKEGKVWPGDSLENKAKIKYLVTGGTHLGIASCYGEKLFEATSIKDLFEQVLENTKRSTHNNEISLDCLGHYFDGAGDIIWVFESEKDRTTVFEFYYKEL